MFTGIVQELGTVADLSRRKGLVRLAIQAPNTASRVRRAESVAVHGVCLSVIDLRPGTLVFEAIPETLRLTSLGSLRAGSRVHLEPSLSVSDRLGGHILFGHVDGVGTVVRRRQRPGELALDIRVPPALRKFLVPKGPVAVDGVSLTVGGSPTASTFSIHLIPETLRLTTLGAAQAGDRVNLELDHFAKLVHQFLRFRNHREG
ncbi:MAG: riboflavin synthase [Candidatus Omnitrophica bacterium]|nr:riboflavin synthase [Candidatus Omnitrophota bacterium]